jgi:hypothetical protein
MRFVQKFKGSRFNVDHRVPKVSVVPNVPIVTLNFEHGTLNVLYFNKPASFVTQIVAKAPAWAL